MPALAAAADAESAEASGDLLRWARTAEALRARAEEAGLRLEVRYQADPFPKRQEVVGRMPASGGSTTQMRCDERALRNPHQARSCALHARAYRGSSDRLDEHGVSDAMVVSILTTIQEMPSGRR